MLSHFTDYRLEQIPRDMNNNTDVMARLASAADSDLGRIIPIEYLPEPSIKQPEMIMVIDYEGTWMAHIIKCLRGDGLPDDKNDARKIKRMSLKYHLDNDILYKAGYTLLMLRCLTPSEAQRVLEDIHEGDCVGHPGAQMLVQKIYRQGYYWPTVRADARAYVWKCHKF